MESQPPQIVRRAPVRTEEDISAQADHDVSVYLHAKYDPGSFFGQIMIAVERHPLREDRVTSIKQAEVARLSQDATLRQAPAIPQQDYRAVPHPEIKDSVTVDADPARARELGDAWIDLGAAMIGFQDRFAAAIEDSARTWEGAAGDAARRFLADVGTYIGEAGSSAQLTGRQAQLHADALADARRMPDPIPYDPVAATAEWQAAPFFEKDAVAQRHWDTYNASNAAHDEAARAASQFDGTIAASSAMPAFSAPPAMHDAERPGPPPGPDDPPPSSPWTGRPPTSPEQPRDSQTDLSFTDTPGGGHPTPPTSPQPRTDPAPIGGWTVPPHNQPPHSRTPQSQSPQNRSRQSQSPQNHPPQNRSLQGQPPQSRSPLDQPRREAGAGRPGAGSGPRTAGPGSGTTPPPATQRPGGTDQPRGGPSTRGAMAPGIGASRGQGDEDTEHQRPSYLIEDDPESLFGLDQTLSPPVIGE